MKTLTIILASAFLLNLSSFTNCFADYEVEIVASDAGLSDNFGQSVAINGNYAIVGSYIDGDAGAASGSAYIFRRIQGNWVQQAKLTASDADAGDRFGFSVAIEENFVIVGAWGNDDAGSNSGSAYIFKRTLNSSVWAEVAKLTASDASADDNFGWSVGIETEILGSKYAVVGAPDENGNSGGSAYVFSSSNGNSWSEQVKLIGSDTEIFDRFGISVAIDFDYLIIGADLENNKGEFNSGSAYIFKRLPSGTSWGESFKLLSSSEGFFSSQERFGNAVSLSIGNFLGDYAIIGAEGRNRAFIFKRVGVANWIEQKILFGNDTVNSDDFGISVSIDDSIAIVGSDDDDIPGFGQAGSAYIFQRNGGSWTQERKITDENASFGHHFGRSVSVSGSYAIVGAPSDGNGSAHLYSVSPFGNGNVGINISANQSVSFNENSGNSNTPDEDTGININFSGVTNTATVQVESFFELPTGTLGISGNAQEVRWEISDGGLIFGNAEIRIDLTALPITLSNPSSAIVYHRSNPGTGTFTALPTTLDGDTLVANTPSFSEFVIGGGDSPLAVEFDSFSAEQVGNTIQLNWSTASEKDNEGFKIYRQTSNDDFVEIASYKRNAELVGTLNSSTVNNYTFVDDSELKNGETYTYVISDVETNGKETKHENLVQSVKFELREEVAKEKLDYVLEQNFPNPFNPTTTINYELRIRNYESGKIAIFNVSGEKVKEFKLAGEKGSVVWDGTNSFGKQVSSGTYFYKLTAGIFSETKKMILLK